MAPPTLPYLAVAVFAVNNCNYHGVNAFSFPGGRPLSSTPPPLIAQQLSIPSPGRSTPSSITIRVPLELTAVEGRHRSRPYRLVSALFSSKDGAADDETKDDGSSAEETDSSSNSSSSSSSNNNGASKREMLKFAIPALGIYLTNPLLSNIDNAFVGRTVGAVGLAALSPATLCIDQVLYLFSFLSRAATALAARGYNASTNKSEEEARNKMKEAASPALSVAVFSGIVLSIWYATCTPSILKTLNVDPQLHQSAASYIRLRGTVAWAAMAQSVLLTLFMVAKDAVTPLKIISAAAVLNVIGDTLFCARPLRTGCGGAAAATAIATLVSTAWMVLALRARNMLPEIKLPNKREVRDLLSFTGPLLAITLTRMAGFVNMQRRAMMLGTTEMLAGYQLCSNLLIFFILFGEPLSQLGQTKMPALIDSNDTKEAMATFKSILTLSTFAAVGVGSAAYLTALLGPGMFSSNLGVQAVAKAAAPSLFFAVSQTIVGIAVDGCMMASRDFGFMLASGLMSFALQAKLLTYCTSVGHIFGTFTLRLGIYASMSAGRALLGYGKLGRAIRGERKRAREEEDGAIVVQEG